MESFQLIIHKIKFLITKRQSFQSKTNPLKFQEINILKYLFMYFIFLPKNLNIQNQPILPKNHQKLKYFQALNLNVKLVD